MLEKEKHLLPVYDPVLAGIVGILDVHGQIVGTGFVISYSPAHKRGLIATSTDVVERATLLSIEDALSEKVHILFHNDPSQEPWEASIQSWSASSREDINILKVEGKFPSRVRSLPLSLATKPEGRKVSIFGYPPNNDKFVGEWRHWDVCRPGPKHAKTGLFFLQLESKVITSGYSGAPVWDDAHRNVIGIVTQIIGHDIAGRSAEEAYAVPIEVLQAFYKDVLIDYDVSISKPSPYHGLEPFTEGDAESFFGYEDITNKMAQKLHEKQQFLAVLGPVGSGKSSVVQAGLIPRLRQGEVKGYKDWGVLTVRLSDDPFNQLEAEGLEEASQHLSRGIHAWCQRHGYLRLVFILDQFEEVLHTCPEPLQKRFVEQLIEVIRESTATVILVLKDNFYSLLAKHEDLMAWVEENLINVFAPRTKEAFFDIARKRSKTPGAIKNLDIVELLINKVFEQNRTQHSSSIAFYELIQTQFNELQDQAFYENRSMDDETILDFTSADLNEWANSKFFTLSEKQQRFAKHLFTQVVLLGDEAQGTPDTRRNVYIADLCKDEADYEEAYKTVYGLAEKGLLSTSRNTQTNNECVTIAQDKLISEWQLLREWLDEYRQFFPWCQRFQDRVRAWGETSKGEIRIFYGDQLLDSSGLIEAELWLQKRPEDFDERARDFIQISQQRQIPEEPTSVLPQGELRRQQEEIEQLALARKLSAQAMELYVHPEQVQRGIQLAVEALSHAPCSEADLALRRGLLLLSYSIDCISAQGAHMIAFSRDGRYVVIAREDQNVDIVELATGRQRFRFPHAAPVSIMTFDYNTDYLVTVCSNGFVSVWNISEGKRHFSYFETNRPTAAKFSLDGHYLAVVNWDGAKTSIKVWQVHPWLHHSLLEETHYVNDVDFNHNDALLATGCKDGTVRVWTVASRKGFLRMRFSSSINRVTFSPGGQYLAAASNEGVAVLKIEPIELLFNEGYMAGVHSIIFSPEGNYLASGSNDGIASVWEIPSGRRLAQLWHNGSIHAATFSFDSVYLATVGDDKVVRIWEMGTYQEVMQLIHAEPVRTVSFSPGRRYLFTASDDQTIRVWKAIESMQRTTFASQAPINDIACCMQDDILYLAARCKNNTIWQWQIEQSDNRHIESSLMRRGNAYCVTYSSDGRYLATADGDGSVRIWDVAGGQEIACLSHKSAVTGVSFCRDNSYLATISKNGTVRIWKWETKSEHSTVELNLEDSTNDITLSPNERYLGAAGNDGYARVWEWSISGAVLLFELSHNDAVLEIRFSPDGHFIATVSEDLMVSIWDTSNGSLLFSREHEDVVSTIAFSPDGRHLATASGDHVKLWETATGRLVADLAHSASVHAVSFSSNGVYLATGSGDGIASMWLWRPEDLIYEALTHITSDLVQEE